MGAAVYVGTATEWKLVYGYGGETAPPPAPGAGYSYPTAGLYPTSTSYPETP